MQSKLNSFIKIAAPNPKAIEIMEGINREWAAKQTTAMQAHYSELLTSVQSILEGRDLPPGNFESTWSGALKWAKRSLGKKLSQDTIDAARAVCRDAALSPAPSLAPSGPLPEIQVASQVNNEGWTLVTGRDRRPKKLVAVSGPTDPLSNFFGFKFWHRGVWHGSVEHAYQMEKAHWLGNGKAWNEILAAPDARAAKRISNEWFKSNEFKGRCQGNVWLMKRVQEWDKRKANVALSLLREKAQQCRVFVETLRETSDGKLVHNVHDHFWGTGSGDPRKVGNGKNVFGNLLMQVRNELFGPAPRASPVMRKRDVMGSKMRGTQEDRPRSLDNTKPYVPASVKVTKQTVRCSNQQQGTAQRKHEQKGRQVRVQSGSAPRMRDSNWPQIKEQGRQDRAQLSPAPKNDVQGRQERVLVDSAPQEKKVGIDGRQNKTKLDSAPKDQISGETYKGRQEMAQPGPAPKEKNKGSQIAVQKDPAPQKKKVGSEGREDKTKLDSTPKDKIVKPPSQGPLPQRSRFFSAKRPRQSPSPELASKRTCGDKLVTETPQRPVTERQKMHWEALKDLKSPDRTTNPSTSNLGIGSLSPLSSTLPPLSPSLTTSQPTFSSVVSKPPSPVQPKPCASTMKHYFGPQTRKIRFSSLQSESNGEPFVMPHKVRLERTDDKSKWRMPALSKSMLIVGDSLLSSINSIRQSAANSTQIVSFPGAKYVHLSEIFKKLETPQDHVKHLILNIGINNRTKYAAMTAKKDIDTLVNQAKTKFPNAKLYYASIKNPSLCPQEARYLREQENTWHRVHSIPILSSIANVATVADGLHWTSCTGRNICDNWLDQIHLKN